MQAQQGRDSSKVTQPTAAGHTSGLKGESLPTVCPTQRDRVGNVTGKTKPGTSPWRASRAFSKKCPVLGYKGEFVLSFSQNRYKVIFSSIKLIYFVTKDGEEALFKAPYLVTKTSTNYMLLF